MKLPDTIKGRESFLRLCFAVLLASTAFQLFLPVEASPAEVLLLAGGMEGAQTVCRSARGEMMMAEKGRSSAGGKKAVPPQTGGNESAYDRVQLAVHYGRISLKEGVLLSAKLLYAPQLIPPDSEFAPKPGEPVLRAGEGLTGFYKDVHRVMGDLTGDEKSWLRTLSPDLKAIIK